MLRWWVKPHSSGLYPDSPQGNQRGAGNTHWFTLEHSIFLIENRKPPKILDDLQPSIFTPAVCNHPQAPQMEDEEQYWGCPQLHILNVCHHLSKSSAGHHSPKYPSGEGNEKVNGEFLAPAEHRTAGQQTRFDPHCVSNATRHLCAHPGGNATRLGVCLAEKP